MNAPQVVNIGAGGEAQLIPLDSDHIKAYIEDGATAVSALIALYEFVTKAIKSRADAAQRIDEEVTGIEQSADAAEDVKLAALDIKKEADEIRAAAQRALAHELPTTPQTPDSKGKLGQ